MQLSKAQTGVFKRRVAGCAGEAELDQCYAFEGALKWMEEGGVNIWLGRCALDVFQLGRRGGVGSGVGTETCVIDSWNRAACTKGGDSLDVVIIDTGAI